MKDLPSWHATQPEHTGHGQDEGKDDEFNKMVNQLGKLLLTDQKSS